MEEVLWLSGNLSNGHTDLHDWSLSVLTIKKCLIKGLCFNLVEISIRWPNSQQSPSEIVCTWDSLILWPFQNIRLEVEMWPDEWRRHSSIKLVISCNYIWWWNVKNSTREWERSTFMQSNQRNPSVKSSHFICQCPLSIRKYRLF